ncbi:MAG TPA: SDR family oxidoreductase [Xanthobacteraceae bacterium]|nr:SDR family oxidoreductase [Xanthobacteraceae bacterium]
MRTRSGRFPAIDVRTRPGCGRYHGLGGGPSAQRRLRALCRRQGRLALVDPTGRTRSVAGQGVRFNAVAPSAIVTDRLAAQPLEIRQAIAQGFPLKRLGTIDDVTAATLLLLSDAASWITGATLDVAGGRV